MTRGASDKGISSTSILYGSTPPRAQGIDTERAQTDAVLEETILSTRASLGPQHRRLYDEQLNHDVSDQQLDQIISEIAKMELTAMEEVNPNNAPESGQEYLEDILALDRSEKYDYLITMLGIEAALEEFSLVDL